MPYVRQFRHRLDMERHALTLVYVYEKFDEQRCVAQFFSVARAKLYFNEKYFTYKETH
jgi:hypothetical protein